MKKLTLITLSFCIFLTGEILAKELTLNQILSSTSKVNTSLLKNTSSNGFKENCEGSGSSKRGHCIIAYDSSTYIGEVKYGQPNGKGVKQWHDSGSSMIGEFTNGAGGHVIFIWDDGTYFQGYINQDSEKSFGLLYYKNRKNHAIYLGGVETSQVGTRQGLGLMSYYPIGEDPDLNSDPLEAYVTVFNSNISQSEYCIRITNNQREGGRCWGNNKNTINL